MFRNIFMNLIVDEKYLYNEYQIEFKLQEKILEELKKYNLDISGNKAELANRLHEYLENIEVYKYLFFDIYIFLE